MQTTATLADEAFSLFRSLPAQKMRTVIQFTRFIAQQPEEEAEFLAAAPQIPAVHDQHDIQIINTNAEYLNAGAEENLEFQADIWEEEE
ncbi:MAG: hypothetical protein IJU95_09970 [Treponema sp.]|nr:hypothetical protein [Treponema sp.]